MERAVQEDMDYERRLAERFRWADEALRKADFEECGSSEKNGRSVYYSWTKAKCKCAEGCQCPCLNTTQGNGTCSIHNGDPGVVGACGCDCRDYCRCGEEYRIRVSDHYAHDMRFDPAGRTSFNHTIRVDGPGRDACLTQQEVETLVQEDVRLVTQ